MCCSHLGLPFRKTESDFGNWRCAGHYPGKYADMQEVSVRQKSLATRRPAGCREVRT
jgi:hypothetical protein